MNDIQMHITHKTLFKFFPTSSLLFLQEQVCKTLYFIHTYKKQRNCFEVNTVKNTISLNL